MYLVMKKGINRRKVLLGVILATPVSDAKEVSKNKVLRVLKNRSIVQFEIVSNIGSAVHKVNGVVKKVLYGNKKIQGKQFKFLVDGSLPQLASQSDRYIDLVIEEDEDGKFSVLEIWG